jgi:excisionase family DNA binding protein
MTKKNSTAQKPETTPDFLNIDLAAARFGVTVRTLRNWRARRLIPFYKIGHSIRFRAAEIDEHLQRNCRVAPKA